VGSPPGVCSCDEGPAPRDNFAQGVRGGKGGGKERGGEKKKDVKVCRLTAVTV